VAANVSEDVRAQVAAGRVVALTTVPVGAAGWEGFGYAVIDPETGNAGYMLAGGLAGGVSVWEGIEQMLWITLTGVLVFGPISPVIQVVAFLVGSVSIGMTYGTTMDVLGRSTSEDRPWLIGALSAAFVACFAGLQAIAAIGLLGAPAPGATYLLNPNVGQALAVAALATALSFWAFSVWVRAYSD
jgi:hypothetical protein